MADTTTVCPECREMQENRAWVLPALGHPECRAVIRAERLAARKFWIRIGPNGCVTGSVLEAAVGPLAEDAHKEFTPRVKDRRREAAEGWRHELVSHAEWKERAEPCFMGTCQHRKQAAS
ncbi:hypothetical protein [Streptomyces antimycoticus]